jgi:hypothetical protein
MNTITKKSWIDIMEEEENEKNKEENEKNKEENEKNKEENIWINAIKSKKNNKNNKK